MAEQLPPSDDLAELDGKIQGILADGRAKNAAAEQRLAAMGISIEPLTPQEAEQLSDLQLREQLQLQRTLSASTDEQQHDDYLRLEIPLLERGRRLTCELLRRQVQQLAPEGCEWAAFFIFPDPHGFSGPTERYVVLRGFVDDQGETVPAQPLVIEDVEPMHLEHTRFFGEQYFEQEGLLYLPSCEKVFCPYFDED